MGQLKRKIIKKTKVLFKEIACLSLTKTIHIMTRVQLIEIALISTHILYLNLKRIKIVNKVKTNKKEYRLMSFI
jgi:hypothetical protein